MSKICKLCNKPIRLFRERLMGYHMPCAKQVMNTITSKMNNPKSMKEVMQQCKAKGINEEETIKEINNIKKIIEDGKKKTK